MNLLDFRRLCSDIGCLVSKRIADEHTYMFERKCEDCVHFNPKRSKDESEHYCLLWLKSAASFGCTGYELKQQNETNDLLG